MSNLSSRHPATQEGVARLHPGHLADRPHLFALAEPFHAAALLIVAKLPDSADLSEALRKLWEAKNCAVYAGVRDLPPAVQREGAPGE